MQSLTTARPGAASPIPETATVRTDIQALRGIAVLSVLLYHSGLGIARSGYLGVDIFFVISGFLITGIIARGIEQGRFSFRTFYERRIRRLAPAALIVLAVTTLAAMPLMTSRQYGLFLPNLAGSLFFVANYTLWLQTGYFHPDSEFQPLLHMWSLAIEEQYYLLMPLMLFVMPRRAWRWVIGLATLVSLALAIWLWPTRAGIAFFWLPPRAWELGLGSLAALFAHSAMLTRVSRRLFWPALLLLLASVLLVFPGPKPGLGAIAACVATAVIILARHQGWDGWKLAIPIAAAGNISYSLYLIHWPMFAYVRMVRMDADLPVWLAIGIAALSIILAALLYRFVEQPGRASRLGGIRLFALWIGASLAILAAAVAYRVSDTPPAATSELDTPTKGLSAPGCFDENGGAFDDRCRQPGTVRMMLWGDSYSSHLVPGLAATTPVPFMQAPRPHCSTFIDYGAYNGVNERKLAEGCILYFRQAVEYLKTQPNIEVVVIAALFDRAVPPTSTDAVRYDGRRFIPAPLGVDATIDAMARTVMALRGAGKRVVVVTAAPPTSANLGECWLRSVEHRPGPMDCDACRLRRNLGPRAQAFEQMIAGFEQRADVPVIRLDAVICGPDGNCRLDADGKPLFRDSGHFTPYGSLWVGTHADLGHRAVREAR